MPEDGEIVVLKLGSQSDLDKLYDFLQDAGVSLVSVGKEDPERKKKSSNNESSEHKGLFEKMGMQYSSKSKESVYKFM